MPQPAMGDGPWAEAIAYWLRQRRWRQADLERAVLQLRKDAGERTGRIANTISNACLGRDCQTRTLREIAQALSVPLDAVLVSPVRRIANEDRERMAAEITRRVLREMDAGQSPIEVTANALEQAVDSSELPQPARAAPSRTRKIKVKKNSR